MSLGNRLRALRSAKGLGLRKVASITGISASTLSRVERGLCISDIAIIHKIATFCGVSVDELLETEATVSDADVNAYLIGHGYNLEKLRTEINALIDELRAEAKAILAERGPTP